MQVCILLHVTSWDHDGSSFEIDQGIIAKKSVGTAVEKLYFKLCEEIGLDDGDPFSYRSHIEIDVPNMREEHLSSTAGSESHSVCSRLLNVASLVFCSPANHSRVIYSHDNFETADSWDNLYEIKEGSEWISWTGRSLNKDSLEEIRSIYLADKSLRIDVNKNYRLINAMEYYFHSWNAENIHITCIFLAIILESLFSPSSNTELSHQVAFNTAKFIETDAAKRPETYRIVKELYSLRSKIVLLR